MIGLLLLVVLVLLLFRWLGRRRRTLAGLNASRPTFTVEPPARRMGSRSREAL